MQCAFSRFRTAILVADYNNQQTEGKNNFLLCEWVSQWYNCCTLKQNIIETGGLVRELPKHFAAFTGVTTEPD